MHRANRVGCIAHWSLGMPVIYRHKRLYSNIYKGLNWDEVVRSCKELQAEERLVRSSVQLRVQCSGCVQE